MIIGLAGAKLIRVRIGLSSFVPHWPQQQCADQEFDPGQGKGWDEVGRAGGQGGTGAYHVRQANMMTNSKVASRVRNSMPGEMGFAGKS